MRDESKHQSSSERESDGGVGEGVLLREGREHAEVSKVLNVVVGCSLCGISSHG